MGRKLNIFIDKGADFTVKFDLFDLVGDPVSTAGYDAIAVMRPWYTYGDTTNITVNFSDNQLILSLSANTTSTLRSGRQIYYVDLFDGDTTIRAVEGNAHVGQAITNG